MLILKHTIDLYEADASLANVRKPNHPGPMTTALSTQTEIFDKQNGIGNVGSSRKIRR